MSDTMQFLLWFFGVPATLVAAMLILACIEWGYWRIGHAFAEWQTRVQSWRMQSAEQHIKEEDHRSFLSWLEAQSGASDLGGAVDQELVEVHRQGELIRVLVEHEIPKAVSQCLETHRLMATITGAYHYAEVAYEPECYALRNRVVWLLSHGADLLQNYPLRFNDARLMHNAIVLRKRALPLCRHCPYIELAVDEAPALCPTAELVQVRSTKREAKK